MSHLRMRANSKWRFLEHHSWRIKLAELDQEKMEDFGGRIFNNYYIAGKADA